MKIEPRTITIGDLAEGYADDGDGGVVGLRGKLDIRPAYQREFVYKNKQRNEVIRSVLAGYPLNIMYWAKRPDGRYEVLDGQQRTISICQYVSGKFSIEGLYYSNQPDDIQRRIDNYKLNVYLCDGEPSQKLAWFRIVNIAGEKLTNQELLNAAYPGPWLADAKRYFSRRDCVAKRLGDGYVKGDPNRQELLETALRWISGGAIADYMGQHQHDSNAGELWSYFESVIEWIERTFPQKRAIMQDVDWGAVHAEHGNDMLDPGRLEVEIGQLLSLRKPGVESVIRKPAGVYRYVLDGDKQHLNLRLFNKAQKTAAYERQDNKCAACGQDFEFGQMHGDHIKPWKDGGLTTDDNCQMLCTPCNLRKGSK